MADNDTSDESPSNGRRKEDRRKSQQPFDGPDRRKNERRTPEDRRKAQRLSGEDTKPD